MAEVNADRCSAWHRNGSDGWTLGDWGNAMAGEAGEVCNAIKKLRRIEVEIVSVNDADRQIDTKEQAKAKIGEEIADTILYLDLIASRLGINVPDEIVKKFNSVSEKYGFEHRL